MIGSRVLFELTSGRRITVDGIIINMVNRCMNIDGFVVRRGQNAATFGILI